MHPLVSVIIPVYKVEKYVDRCVKSVLAQTYGNIEIILVDDGSPDRCPAICDDYANRYSNIRVVHKENGGLASARLAGFRESSGEYILFVDSDDYIHPQMVEKLVNAIQAEKAELAMCAHYRADAQGIHPQLLPYSIKCINDRERIEEDYIRPLIGNSYSGINIPGFLWIRLLKRSLIQESFFGSERTYYLEDHYFDLLYGDYVETIAVVNEPLYYYCVNNASLSNCYRPNKWLMYSNLYSFYKEYIKAREIGDCQRRTNQFLLSAFCASVDNAVLSGSYKTYLTELKSIVTSPLYQNDLKMVENEEIKGTYQLTRLLTRLRMYSLLYIIRKSRLDNRG